MKAIIFLGLVLLISSPAMAQLAPYWIPDAECEKGFQDDCGLHTERASEPLSTYNTPYFCSGSGHFEVIYSLDDEGDLCKVREEWLDYTISYNLQWRDYITPLKVLDYPLTTGKTWTSETQYWVNSSGIYWPLTLVGTVVGPTTVETGIGQLDVIEVSYTKTTNNGTYTYSKFLHSQIGDVTNLVSFSGCETVATEEIPWGGIKSMYR